MPAEKYIIIYSRRIGLDGIFYVTKQAMQVKLKGIYICVMYNSNVFTCLFI